MLEYHKMTEEEKYCIARWKYPGEYAIYNSLSYEEQKKRGFGFANPENHLYSFYDRKDLVGFINLNGEDPEVFFGIGTAWEISQTLFPGKPMYLEVRTWNQRAIRCYEKAGFRIVGEPIQQTTSIGGGAFYHMVRRG